MIFLDVVKIRSFKNYLFLTKETMLEPMLASEKTILYKMSAFGTFFTRTLGMLLEKYLMWFGVQ